MKIGSVSPDLFVRYVEPFIHASVETIIDKYRYDAFRRNVTCGCADKSTEACLCAERDKQLAHVFKPHLARGRVVVSESVHPLRPRRHVGESRDSGVEIREVRTSLHARQMRVEFDMRTDVCKGVPFEGRYVSGELTFYADDNCTRVIGGLGGRHGDAREDARGITTCVLPGWRFWLAFREWETCEGAWQSWWGWKIFVEPLFDDGGDG